MNPKLICLVEGQGEVQAVPKLIYRFAHTLIPSVALLVEPWRVSRGGMIKRGELERQVERAAKKVAGRGALLILLDADDDLPCELGPQLLERANAARPDLPKAVVLANREYEAWFLAAAESLRGQRGLADDLSPPENPEGIRGAKEWLQDHAAGAVRYTPDADQAALTSLFDLDQAQQHSPSFDKCAREIRRLLQVLEQIANAE